MDTESPSQGFIFWPIGTGDSTTVLIEEDTVMQVDLNHLECAEDEDDPHAPIIDELIELLPHLNGKPYLSVFVLTHPDEDHCRQFRRLLREVTIGELWFTPRIFREYQKDFCKDAAAFREEAKRRVAETIATGGVAAAGDRVRIIGYDDLLREEEYSGFPEERLTVPGTAITEVDGQDRSDLFRAFVHAPFKDDSAGDRNKASVGLQVRLLSGASAANALLLGDLCYPTIKRIFDSSSSADLAWNLFLAPHHCSKSVMYWREQGDEDDKLRMDILNQIESHASTPAHIVASSEPIPTSNKPGDDPPHAKAKARYREIAPDGFLCTQEEPSTENPRPLVFLLEESGIGQSEAAQERHARAFETTMLAEAVERARGGMEPPQDQVGFGRCH